MRVGQIVKFNYTNKKGETKARLVDVEKVDGHNVEGKDFYSVTNTDKGHRHFDLTHAKDVKVLVDTDDEMYTIPELCRILSQVAGPSVAVAAANQPGTWFAQTFLMANTGHYSSVEYIKEIDSIVAKPLKKMKTVDILKDKVVFYNSLGYSVEVKNDGKVYCQGDEVGEGIDGIIGALQGLRDCE